MNPFIFSIFSTYFVWHYTTALRYSMRIWKNFILFFYHFFSFSVLLSTILEPWHCILTQRGRGFDFGEFARVRAENAISRALGAIMRSIVISAGLFTEGIVLLLGAGFIIFWIGAPIFIPAGFLVGIGLLFS